MKGLGGFTLEGAIHNYAISNATAVTVNTGTPTTIASCTITTRGRPVLLAASGDANPATNGAWQILRFYRDSTAIGKYIIVQCGNASANNPFALVHIDTPAPGTYTYTLKANTGDGQITYGEGGNDQAPTILAVEL